MPMSTTHQTRLFQSGTATTLYLTIPARIVADSQFPFDVDQPVTVTIDGSNLLVTSSDDGADG